MKHTKFTKFGAYGILLVVLGGALNYGEPIFKGLAFAIGLSNKFAKAEEKISIHDDEIKKVSSSIRQFRAVWCMDLLTRKNVRSSVVDTCTKWINEP